MICIYQAFAMNKRENFYFRELIGSPMHLMFLGVSNTSIFTKCMLDSMFNIKSNYI